MENFNINSLKLLCKIMYWELRGLDDYFDIIRSSDFNGKTNLDLYAVWKDIDWTGCTAFKLNITSNNAIVIAHADKLATAKEIAIDFGDWRKELC